MRWRSQETLHLTLHTHVITVSIASCVANSRGAVVASKSWSGITRTERTMSPFSCTTKHVLLGGLVSSARVDLQSRQTGQDALQG